MSENYKPGGGNKPQPFIPAGNGDRSGEYTVKEVKPRTVTKDRIIPNVKLRYNFLHSISVKKVIGIYSCTTGESVPSRNHANSVIKKVVNGYVVSERFFNEDGDAYLDIDYTCHGNPANHPKVPHIHRWYKDSKGILVRNKTQEDFK